MRFWLSCLTLLAACHSTAAVAPAKDAGGTSSVSEDAGIDVAAIDMVALDVSASDAVDPDAAATDTTATCTCGDGTCAAACGENAFTCAADCGSCGNGTCDPGESPGNCKVDCCGGCGDGKCIGYECGETPLNCPKDCGTACGNQVCDKGETPQICPEDCQFKVCGNGTCEGGESAATCPQDCATACGNCTCEGGEDFLSCPVDCGWCGDGVCSSCPLAQETTATCPTDCGPKECHPKLLKPQCNDGNPCTTDACDLTGSCVHLPKSATCTDGDPCSIDDFCEGGDCHPGLVQKNCSDGNACTNDVCDPGKGCVITASSGPPCNDGSLCSTGDTCSNGQCQGVAVDCNDDDVCTSDVCDPVLGCTHLPSAATACDDGNACTVGDQCKGGVCKGGIGKSCDDGNACSADSCDPLQGCEHLAVPGAICSDGDPCTLGDQCGVNGCFGTAKDCDDDNACTKDGCTAGACAHAGINGACTDGNPCTTDDHCVAGGCKGTAIVCDDGNACTTEICLGGSCAYGNAVNGAPCDDGDPCTLSSCQAGVCVGSPALWTVPLVQDSGFFGLISQSEGVFGYGSIGPADASNSFAAWFGMTGKVKKAITLKGKALRSGARMSGDKVVVLDWGGNTSSTLTALDKTGAVLWTVPEPNWGDASGSGTVQFGAAKAVAVAADQVAVTGQVVTGLWTRATVTKIDKTGKTLWTSVVPPEIADNWGAVAVLLDGRVRTVGGSNLHANGYQTYDVVWSATGQMEKSTLLWPHPGSTTSWPGTLDVQLASAQDGTMFLKFRNNYEVRGPDLAWRATGRVAGATVLAMGTADDPVGPWLLAGNPDSWYVLGMFRIHSDGAIEPMTTPSIQLPGGRDDEGGLYTTSAGVSRLNAWGRSYCGACLNESAATCKVIDACHYATCAEQTGCAAIPQTCDDHNPCTTDQCNAKTGCTFIKLADGAACNDGLACTVKDSCWNGVCATAVPLCDDGLACTIDVCSSSQEDAVEGSCQHTPAPAGGTCGTGGRCSAAGECKTGGCTATYSGTGDWLLNTNDVNAITYLDLPFEVTVAAKVAWAEVSIGAVGGAVYASKLTAPDGEVFTDGGGAGSPVNSAGPNSGTYYPAAKTYLPPFKGGKAAKGKWTLSIATMPVGLPTKFTVKSWAVTFGYDCP